MQLRGLACWSGSHSGLSAASGTVGSSRSALLLRLSATAVLSGTVASMWRVISRWASDCVSATCSASPKRPCEERNASSVSRAASLSASWRRSWRRMRMTSRAPTRLNRPLTSSVSQTATSGGGGQLVVAVDLQPR